METHFSASGGHRPGRGELPLRTNGHAIAENALATLQRYMTLMRAASVPVPAAMCDLEEVRKTILEIHKARSRPGMTRNCRGWRAHDLNTAMTAQMFLEAKLDWLKPAAPKAGPA